MRHRGLRSVLVVLALVAGSGSRGSAQNVLEDAVPLGASESPLLLDQLPHPAQPRTGVRAAFAAGQRHYLLQGTPSFASADGQTSYGAAFAYVYRPDTATNKMAFQLTASAKHVDLVGTDRNRVGGEGKVVFRQLRRLAAVAARAAIQRTLGAQLRQDYVLSAERQVRKFGAQKQNAYSVSGSAGWIISHPDGGTSTSAPKVTLGFGLTAGAATRLVLGYAFRNRVDAQDYSITMSQTLQGLGVEPTISLVAGRNRVVAMSVLFSF